MFEIPYDRLSRFAGNLATCIEAGLGIPQGLKSSKRTLSRTRYGSAIEMAHARVKQGICLSEGLAVEGVRWPPFFLPVLKAGEQSGRLDEALRYLEYHCGLLAGPARAWRNVWMFPLAIMLTGTLLKLLAFLLLAPFSTTMSFLFSALQSYGTFALIVFLLVASPFKPVVDRLKAELPLLGRVERELAASSFFRVLAMIYATSGRRVESMIRLAGCTVANLAIRADFDKAATRIEQDASIPEAFEAAKWITTDEHELIASGDLTGTLEKSFELISESASQSLQFRLKIFTQFSVRLTMFVVVGSLAFTLQGLIVAMILR